VVLESGQIYGEVRFVQIAFGMVPAGQSLTLRLLGLVLLATYAQVLTQVSLVCPPLIVAPAGAGL